MTDPDGTGQDKYVTAPTPNTRLADYLAQLAETAPLTQTLLDAGGSLEHAGLRLSQLRVEFGWVLGEQWQRGLELRAGLPGGPLNLAWAALDSTASARAARISLEIHQSPAPPASTKQGDEDG